MSTFDWKWWRFAWLAWPPQHRTTVYDYDGRWESVCGRLCVLVDRDA